MGISEKQNKRKRTIMLMKRYYILYIFLLPAVSYIFIFHYIPMYGVQIAFKDYTNYQGILNSPWIGLDNFTEFFKSYRFWSILKNTFVLSTYSFLVGFPIPIFLALILNYLPNMKLKKVTQTVTYAPYFISIVVVVSMLNLFLSPQSGIINSLLKLIGINPIFFLGNPKWFSHVYVWSGVWQSAGWYSIIYIASLSGVSPELHEAAFIDGASKIKQILAIDIPTILPTIIILLILNLGQLLNVGYEKVYLLQNSLNIDVSEVISTYTYKVGLVNAEFSYSTAIGLFNNIINFIMLIFVNKIAKKVSDVSLW